jgi:hypothetical protein
MTRLGIFLAALAAMFGLTIVNPSLASAGECTILPGGGAACGQLRHYSPDDGYDAPILIRCNFGDPSTNHELYEGQNSSSYCRDTDQIGVRANEEIWCKRIITTGVQQWQLVADAQGWHKINDLFDDGVGCSLRRD